jgi:hypothetical protein
MGFRRLVAGAAATIAALAFASTATASTTSTSSGVPRLNHVILIMEENNGFSDVIGNKAAPNLNYLAHAFGLETKYYGVSQDSSETNYVGLLGGSTDGVTSDDPYWKNRVNEPSLITQLDKAGISWKAYLQSLPYAGYQGICYPAKCNGSPDSDPLYVSKHDAIQNFTGSWNARDWSRQVPVGQLSTDLRSGNVPTFSYIVPDECHDMHGDPPFCIDSGNIGDPQNQRLVAQGDAYLGQLVSQITHASFWSKGNNAILITYDNGDTNAGCCDANNGGGQVATVVITSHGPRHATLALPANHYSLLQTIQDSLGLGCLKFTCDTVHVKPLGALLKVTGTPAIATKVQPELPWPTPTPSQPAEKLGTTTQTGTSGGWSLVRAQTLGSSDNNLGAIAASSPSDIWAVGNYLPDAKGSNVDATLTFAEHYNGKAWTVVRTPNAGPDFNTLFGVAASMGKAWAVGVRMDAAYRDRALAEYWNGSKPTIQNVPQPGSERDLFYGASATAPNDVWAVGDQEGTNGVYDTLAEHFDGKTWSVLPTPDPGKAGDHLYAVDAVAPNDVWAAGQQLNGPGVTDQGLIEHWDGKHWSVVKMPRALHANVMLDGVTVSRGQVFVVGEVDSPGGGGRPLVVTGNGRHWASFAPSDGSDWSSLWAVTATSDGTVYAAGNYVDLKTDNTMVLLYEYQHGRLTLVHAPSLGVGGNIAGGIAAVGTHVWMAGTYAGNNNNLPMLEVH